MKKIIFFLMITGLSVNAIAQKSIPGDTTCSFLKNLIFKNGVDTIVVKVTYNAIIRGSDGTFLKLLADNKQLQFNEYVDDYESIALYFIPESCKKIYQGTLSRKIYDKTFVRKTYNIGEYMKEIIDTDSFKIGQVMYLKCIVFEDPKVYYHKYFFTVVDIRLL